MASELVYNIGEQFCQCAICLKPFSEPKVLPCLHRFCKDCLSSLFENLTEGDILYCPICRAELAVTRGGVEDMKTDFLVSELTKVIQLQNSLQSQNQIRRCEGCNKEDESSGFCSKCGGFLCQNCFNFHQKFKTSMLKDHQPVIDLKDVFSGKVKIGMEKLSQFTKAPRCQNHPENILRLSCLTCEGQQICIVCTYEDHMEHKAESIRNMARNQYDDLQKKLDELRQMETNWEGNVAVFTIIKEKLCSEVTEVKRRVSRITEEKLEKLTTEKENVTLRTETKVRELKESSASEKIRLENEKNEKIKKIERKYNDLLEKHNADMQNSIEKEIEYGKNRRDEIDGQITVLKAHCDEMITAITQQLHRQNSSLDGLVPTVLNTQKRFENFITTGSNVLSLANDWSAIEIIPSLCFAFDGIKDEVKKMKAILSELEDESKLGIPTVIESAEVGEIGFVKRERYLKSQTNLESTEEESFIPLEFVDQIVFLKSCGCFAMSGNLTTDNSAAVIKVPITSGKQEYLKCFNECSEKKPFCLICKIDEDVIATACDKSLGTIDVQKSIYYEQKVNGEGCFASICADQTMKQILAFETGDNVVKVFDLNINLIKTRKLPDVGSVVCMGVHDGKLIIGSEEDKQLYVLGEDDEIVHVIPPPGLQREEGEVWDCLGICSSGNGTLCALWCKSMESETAEDLRYIILYTPTYYPFEIIPTCSDVTHLALMEKDGAKKIVILSGDKLDMYNIW